MKRALDPSKDSSMAESSEKNPKRPKHEVPSTEAILLPLPASEDSSMADTNTSKDPSMEKNPYCPLSLFYIKEKHSLDPINSFSLIIHPGSKLNQAIEALSYANSQGLASIIEVVADRIRILCQMQFNSLCYLDLKPGQLMNLSFNKRFKKMVSLKQIFNTLDGSDDKIVEIEHADGSEELTFTIEEMRCGKSVTVLGVDAGFKMVPNIIPIFEAAIIDRESIGKIILQVEADESKPVVFEMLNGTVSIKVEQKELASFKYKENDANRGIARDARCAWFQFVHCKCLKKALLLAEEVLVCLGTDQRVCLTLRFNLGELGDLVYILFSIDPSQLKPETSMGHPALASGAAQ